MIIGFYKASNRTRKLKYNKKERNIRLVLEALESLERSGNIKENIRGIVKTSAREIADIIYSREAGEISMHYTTVSRCLNELCEDGDIEILQKSNNKSDCSIYKLLSFCNTTDKTSNINGCDGFNATDNGIPATVRATDTETVHATDKTSNINGCDGLTEMVRATDTETVSATFLNKKYIKKDNKNIYSFTHEEGQQNLTASQVINSESINLIIKKWNSIHNIPQIKAIKKGTKRYRLLQARLKEYELSEILKAIDIINQSSFLKGINNREWKIKIDWFLEAGNFIKVIENSYTDTESITNETVNNYDNSKGRGDETEIII
ncbi:hypothetical protein [Peptostreptococcus porci]|uniref:hypothetical protein n=1 Tax=Peptostreptococcus porci TaxID=2652282 RepID=UPI0023F37F29|nr:hypothetical protein [Peptostreptococcus porci]MDD7183293.1 hypothetical protein [Peptostreptococcus porci]MDY4127970.1 hypothetical protein [Peptostreptococcus porci]MDY4561807.1 hypothetical protein [Peptostreptococcus porci]